MHTLKKCPEENDCISGQQAEVRCQRTLSMKAQVLPPHRVIREIESGLYLSPGGDWVRAEEEAFDFPDLRSALTTCEQMQERGVEMLMIFDHEQPGAVRA